MTLAGAHPCNRLRYSLQDRLCRQIAIDHETPAVGTTSHRGMRLHAAEDMDGRMFNSMVSSGCAEGTKIEDTHYNINGTCENGSKHGAWDKKQGESAACAVTNALPDHWNRGAP